jgi:hypothetical protein
MANNATKGFSLPTLKLADETKVFQYQTKTSLLLGGLKIISQKLTPAGAFKLSKRQRAKGSNP